MQDLTSGQGNLALGQFAGGNLGDSGVTRIGTAGYQYSAFISGIYTSNLSGTLVLVNSSGQLGIATSSRRSREDIQDMGDASGGLLGLRRSRRSLSQFGSALGRLPNPDGEAPSAGFHAAERTAQLETALEGTTVSASSQR
jgi:hypothetical protein